MSPTMEENKPPSAKLKQGTLSFLKSTPVLVKNNIHGQGKKRRSSHSDGLDSPTKLSKSGKPLNLIALDNTECLNTKAQKIRKISFPKAHDGNDHEVSSSSEAEVGGSKCSSGNLLDRFIRKLPQGGHQEISSTNEMLEISHQRELLASQESAAEDQTNENNTALKFLHSATKDAGTSEHDCIIIDDIEEAIVEKTDTGFDKTPCKAMNVILSKSDSKLSANVSDACIQEETNIVDNKLTAEIINNDVFRKENEDVIQDIDNSAFDLDTSSVDENNTVSSEEHLDDSAVDMSTLSAECSTPKKDNGSAGTDMDNTLDLSGITATTPAANSEKKKRKVDSANKAEKDNMKLKRQNEKLERKRKLEEEKTEKERIKREKKETKEKEKQEQKEKLEKEKQEKERAKEEERKKREEEKIKKEEEKRKKQAALEAKQEEKRKKEEEKKQKEEDKLREEDEKKKKEQKTKQAFQSFFIKPKESNVKPAVLKPSTGMFIPFELKKDMHLAPTVRRHALTEDKKTNLDQILTNNENCMKTYLEQLKHGDVTPHKTGRILRKNPQPSEDVEIIHDSEALKKVFHCVKLLQFHTDHRPPYYGTWRKKPALSPRCPWKKDKSVFDYEVDSDEEWEEEEPGESLSCSDGEEEKGEEIDDEDDDGWMVPHGYLSEDEGCNEDDEITPEKLKLQQLAKAKAWEEEQKQKLQVSPAITVGCFFENSPCNKMMGDVRLLYEFMAVVLVSTPIQTSLFGCTETEKSDETISERAATTPSQKGFKKQTVPDEAVPDLIRLIHGNVCGIKRLIREFRVYWLRKSIPPSADNEESAAHETSELEDSFVEKNMDISCLNESVNESCIVSEPEEQKGEIVCNGDKKPREEGYGCSISKRQLEMKIMKMAVREKRPGFNKICWYVHENILAQYNMSDLKLPNSWVHLLPGHVRSPVSNASKSVETPLPSKIKVCGVSKPTKSPKTGKAAELPDQCKVSSDVQAEMTGEDKTEGKEIQLKKIAKDQRSIKDFALSNTEIIKKMKNQPAKIIATSSPKATVVGKEAIKRKRPQSQKCIVDFANSSRSKTKKLVNDKTQSTLTGNISKPLNAEIICVDSNSVTDANCVENAQVASCPEITSSVVETTDVSSSTSQNAQSILSGVTSDILPTSETPTKTLPYVSTEVLPKDTDFTATGPSQEENTIEPKGGSGSLVKSECEVECIVID